jgi:N-acetylglutamate synthase-like GNAT family acetyltransferase
MIRLATEKEINIIWSIINDAAQAYKGIIPYDCWHDPYMGLEELKEQVSDGVSFWCFEDNKEILGVMGLQNKTDVSLIRHAYTRTSQRNRGIGTKLLTHLRKYTNKPILIGTWAAADWAIRFYEKNGFVVVDDDTKTYLLQKYWNVPDRQIETSVVLADEKWINKNKSEK